MCWEGGFNAPGLCAVYSETEPPPIFGAVNVEHERSLTHDTATITNAGDVNFTHVWFGSYIPSPGASGGPRVLPARSVSDGSLIDSDGTFGIGTKVPSDLVATGTRPDGAFVGVMYRNLDLFASQPMTVDVSGAQPFRTAALTIPSDATDVQQHLFTAGHTAVNFPASSSVRYGLPEGQALPGDLYSIEFDYGTGTYAFTTSTFADLDLQPSALSEITGFGVTIDQMGTAHTMNVTWDSYPGAVGYRVGISFPICCGSPKWRYEQKYFSEAALGGPGCRRTLTRRYVSPGPYGTDVAHVTVQAVTSSRGPEYFPLGWPSEEMLVGLTNGVHW